MAADETPSAYPSEGCSFPLSGGFSLRPSRCRSELSLDSYLKQSSLHLLKDSRSPPFPFETLFYSLSYPHSYDPFAVPSGQAS